MILSDLVLFLRSFVLDSGWFSGSEHNHLLGTHHNSFDRTQVITLIQSWPIGGSTVLIVHFLGRLLAMKSCVVVLILTIICACHALISPMGRFHAHIALKSGADSVESSESSVSSFLTNDLSIPLPSKEARADLDKQINWLKQSTSPVFLSIEPSQNKIMMNKKNFVKRGAVREGLRHVPVSRPYDSASPPLSLSSNPANRENRPVLLVGKSMSKSEIEGSVYFSILLVSCFTWSGALDSSDILQLYPITSLSYHITNMLIFSLFQQIHIYLRTCRQPPAIRCRSGTPRFRILKRERHANPWSSTPTIIPNSAER